MADVLPFEIWLRIFSFIDGKILLNTVALVCGQWRSLVDDEEVWETQVRRILADHPDPVLAPPPTAPTPAPTAAAAAGTTPDSPAPTDYQYTHQPFGLVDEPLLWKEVGRTGEVEAEAEEKIEVWDREALKRREKKRKTEENRRAFRARAESWVKPKDRTWKWLYRAKTNCLMEIESPSGIGWKEWNETDGTFVRYEGEWKEGQFHGAGIKWHRDEDKQWKCVGQFANDYADGEANAVWAHTMVIYEGLWQNGLPHGYGVKSHPKDGKYEGMWVEGMETGHGRHSWNDGSYFEGDWVGGQQNGHGTYVWKSGNCFTGLWENCNQVKGVNTWFDGRSYDGEYHAGEKRGQGTYTWADGSVYKGGWDHGLRQGEGRMDWPDGTWFLGVWDRDDRVEVRESNVRDWNKRDKPYDLYFLEDGDVWNRKYMHDIKERRRQKKLAIEEERLKQKLLDKKTSTSSPSSPSVGAELQDFFDFDF